VNTLFEIMILTIDESENVFTGLNKIVTSMRSYLMNNYTTLGTLK